MIITLLSCIQQLTSQLLTGKQKSINHAYGQDISDTVGSTKPGLIVFTGKRLQWLLTFLHYFQRCTY